MAVGSTQGQATPPWPAFVPWWACSPWLLPVCPPQVVARTSPNSPDGAPSPAAPPQVLLRKLDPKTRLLPRGDAHVSIWQPKALTLIAHRLGLVSLAAGRRLLVTAGATGSVKLTPEGALRVLAADGGVRLPPSASAVAEALTALLLGGGQGNQSAAAAATAAAAAVAVLQTAGSAASSAPAAAAAGGLGLLSQYGSMHNTASAGQLHAALLGLDAEQLARASGAGGGAAKQALASQLQEQQRQSSSGPGTPAAAPVPPGARVLGPSPLGLSGGASTDGGGSSVPPSEPQSARNSGVGRRDPSGDGSSGAAAAAAAPGAAAAAAGAGEVTAAAAGQGRASASGGLQRAPSSSWPQQQQLALDSPWVLRYEDLKLGRVVGEGAFGYGECSPWW
jgi:hypothetical protein